MKRRRKSVQFDLFIEKKEFELLSEETIKLDDNIQLLNLERSSLSEIDVILRKSYQRLHDGHWKSINPSWRYVYGICSLRKALIEMENNTNQQI